MILSQAAALLSAHPGNLVYHLVLAFSLALTAGAALALRKEPAADPLAARWWIAGGGLLAARLLVMAASSLTLVIVLNPLILLPPLDRFASFAGVAIFGWVLLAPHASRRADTLLIIAILLALILAALSSVSLASGTVSGSFNQSNWDLVWGISGLVICLGIIVFLLRRRPDDWPLAVGAFGLLTAGYMLHISFGGDDGSLAGLVRLGELGAYPLFALLGFRSLALATRPIAAPAAAAPPAAPAVQPEPRRRRKGEPDLILTLIDLLAADQIEDLARHSVQAVARSLRAEYCLLLTSPDASGDFTIATAYDLIRERHLPGAALNGEGFPVIREALLRKRALTLPSQSDSKDLQSLRQTLNIDDGTSALLAPVVAGMESFGGLLLLSPFAQRVWPVEDQRLLESIAVRLGQRFRELRRAGIQQSASDGAEAPTEKLQSQLEQLHAENERLRQDVESLQARDEADALAEVLAMHEGALHTIENLEREVERLQTDLEALQASAEEDDLAPLAAELQEALQELSNTRSRLQDLEASQGQAAEGPAAPAGHQPDMEAIASTAQELRQPMSSILGYTDLMLGESVGLLGAMQRKFLERVRNGIERMGYLLNDLIQLTAIETGALSLTPEPVDLLTCVEEAVMQVSPLLRDKRLALRMDFPDDLPPVIGDEDAVVQILIHLIENAIGASVDDEEVVAAARLHEDNGEGFLLLTMTDHGEGIPAEDLGRVFQRVYRADNSLIQGVGDHGVGLSLVKSLSEALGGRVWVNSQVGVGSTFTVLLPAAAAAESPPQESEPQPS